MPIIGNTKENNSGPMDSSILSKALTTQWAVDSFFKKAKLKVGASVTKEV